MAQWELCRAVWADWLGYFPQGQAKSEFFVDYFSLTGVITKFPPIDSFGHLIGILSAAEWELINVQHSLITVTSTGGQIIGVSSYLPHPSGNTDIRFMGAKVVAYFKRPIQAGRAIDDAL